MTPSVSIILVTYKRPESLKRTLTSLSGNIPPKTEIIVVEQGGDHGSGIRTHANKMSLPLTYIHEDVPGMTRARNIGLKAATGTYIIYFDDDVDVHGGCVQTLSEALSGRNIGMVGGRVCTPGQPLEPNRRDTGRISFWGRFSDGFSSEVPQETDTVIGCCMGFRREVLLDIGGFDERFTASALREESDVALRVKSKGYAIQFVPAAGVTHLREPVGGARKSEGRLAWYYQFFSNETYFCLKHRPAFVLPVYLAMRSEFALRCMFGFGREVSPRSLTTPLAGIIDGMGKYRSYAHDHRR